MLKKQNITRLTVYVALRERSEVLVMVEVVAVRAEQFSTTVPNNGSCSEG